MNTLTRTPNFKTPSFTDSQTPLEVYPFVFNPQVTDSQPPLPDQIYPTTHASQQSHQSHPEQMRLTSSSNPSFSAFPLNAQTTHHSTSEIGKLINDMVKKGYGSKNDYQQTPETMLGILREFNSENVEDLALKVSNLRSSESKLVNYEGAYLGCRKGDTVFNLCFRAFSETGDSIMQSIFTNVISNLSSYMQKNIQQNKKNTYFFKKCIDDTRLQFEKFPWEHALFQSEKKSFSDKPADEFPPAEKKTRHDFHRESGFLDEIPSQTISEQFVPPQSFYVPSNLTPTALKSQDCEKQKFLTSKRSYEEMNRGQPLSNATRKYTPNPSLLTVPGMTSRIMGLGKPFLFPEHLEQRAHHQIFVEGRFILAYLQKIENLTENDFSLETVKDIGRLRCSNSGTIDYKGSKINIKNDDTLFSIVYREFKSFEDKKAWFKLFTILNKIYSKMEYMNKKSNSDIFKSCFSDTLKLRKLL